MNQVSLENFKIDKSNWEKVKLGDLVFEPKEAVRDIVTKGIQHVVGLEHLYSEDIHLRHSANIDDSTTFTKKFKRGDVLFGRRRAYLKKAALAEFDGICSGDITVLRAKNALLPDLLPFIIHNEKFFDYAVTNSAGGLSPRVKFKDLANYTFLLPPKEQQIKLSELLWALDKSIESDTTHKIQLVESYTVLLNQFMIHGCHPFNSKVVESKCGLLDSRIDIVQLKDCLSEKPAYGANASSKPAEDGDPRYIRITDIDDDGRLVNDDVVTIDEENYDDYILEDNDFLFARTGNTVGKTLLYRSSYGRSVFAGYLIRFRLNINLLRPKFLFYFSKSLKFESFKRKIVKIGAQPNINSEEYQSMHLPKLSIDEQDLIVSNLDSYHHLANEADEKIQSSRILLVNLINQIF